MATPEFKGRLKAAVRQVVGSMALDTLSSQRLYTPVFRNGSYSWVSPMDSDGLLVRERSIDWEGTRTGVEPVKLRIGVIIQAEASTSLTKPNPFGKALVASLPLGVWVDVGSATNRVRRVRLDRAFVLFVVPLGMAPKHSKTHKTAWANISNAAAATDDAHMIEVPRGIAARALADRLKKVVNSWLVGRGRPVGK